MGQAKQRGTRDQRVAKKYNLVERPLDDIKREANIPADAKFLGYGVHLEATDEFLLTFEENAAMQKKTWAKTPEFAKLFIGISDAYEIAQKCAGSVVVGIFDSEKQIWVAVAQ